MSSLVATQLAKELLKKTERTDLTVEALMQSFLDNLFFVQGRSPERATGNDLYMALAHSVRDRLVERWISTIRVA
jgi:starch phosphorylase